ncbi:DUF5916 domain-containing protein [Frigoriflavimonas asaccharolytica]|uniref:Carbohydrate binding protein with CBM9 domain n=1 Tax=Frigoriflavimonas asaccharolytica TaxID=2735899 RepID=A0A8J8GC43_9FLAO|nr:DUF5916 domain-containing protein [Frigoriflavimonas asaccharolytica]NRS92992.1 hypothetical protein [Frigoriflavimonas asaccharolytica]
MITSKKTSNIKIDGILDDEAWMNVPVAKNFIERDPNNGAPESEDKRTEVKILYDDDGLYIAARMYDPEPHLIQKELVERDDVGNDDIFAVLINGYNDKQQSLQFLVMPTGVQYDAKITTDNGEDSSWNAVWQSAAHIDDQGWTVEIRIPYFELRFPKKAEQNWGINFFRRIQRTRTSYDWNMVDNTKGSSLLYDGNLLGIENINPPIRLSFLPYFSTYTNSYDGQSTQSINGGMDVKYGISDAFTLDTTLIPDFGQANIDRRVLNLSPFEQQFEEQRSFFTEGTELFNKGNLFYSRRVGGSPSRYPNTNDDENVEIYPTEVKLINATKISGRTSTGLGIGVFNGITERARATIKNEITGETREEIVEPLANYNVLVLDQRFRENSSLAFVNTSTLREGDFRDANVSALLLDLTNKANTYNFFGNAKGSWVKDGEDIFGTELSAGFGKISGKHRFSFNTEVRTKDYNIDDLGYTGGTNYFDANAYYGFRILQPTKRFNNININTNLSHRRRLETDLYGRLELNSNISFTDKEFRNFGGGIEVSFTKENDFYEPRRFGRYLQLPGYFDSWLWYNSDSRKKFRYNLSVDYYAYDEKARNTVNFNSYFSYRFSDKISAYYDNNFQNSNNETGFAGRNTDDIFISRRRVNSAENRIGAQYTINDKMGLNFAFRHYYSEVNNNQFYSLNQDGTLTNAPTFNKDNETFNTWNVDLRYSWWFAPGSNLTLLFRNATQNYLSESRINFKNNFQQLFNEPMANNLSLKITYFLDYNKVKKVFN